MKYKVKSKKGMDYYVEAPEGATWEQISEAIRDQLDERAWNDLGVKQQLEERQHFVNEVRGEDAARARALKTLDIAGEKIQEEKKAKSDIESSTLEKEIRRRWLEENALGKEVEAAEQKNDKKSWEAAMGNLSKLGARREELFKKLEKVNPGKAKSLYNELFQIKE